MEQWAGQERLRFIELAAYWRGYVNRPDICGVFGVSGAQASGDLQGYQELNPGALVYNMNKKRYEGAREMTLIRGGTSLEEAMLLFLTQGDETRMVSALRQTEVERAGTGGGRVEFLQLPRKQTELAVERRLFQAVLGGMRMRIKYFSVHGRSAKWRWIRPHAFAHNGHRWHVRAWCEENAEYRDFVIARMAEAEWPEVAVDAVPRDVDWETLVSLKLRPASNLSAEQRDAVLLEYAMGSGGTVTITCRKAMEGYVRSRLHLAMADGQAAMARLEMVED